MNYENMSREKLIELLRLKDLKIGDLIDISSLDYLTKVFNRRAGIEKFNEVYRYSLINDEDISICFADVDNLKLINDTWGHKCGDQTLIDISYIIKRNIRKDDFIFRFGGDEFVIIFPNTSTEKADKVLKRICKNLSEINVNRKYKLGLSYGLCSYKEFGKCNMSFDDFLDNADSAMYINKNNNLITVDFKKIKK